MDHRIGSLHLRYRVHGSTDAALSLGIDRALQDGLAHAVTTRLDAMFGDDPSVVVVRELGAAVALSDAGSMLTSGVVERVCASSLDALSRMLARETSSDSVIRFADEAEFVGSFIVDLLAGLAWNRWYYGALQRYRRSDPRATIHAVLAESGIDAARVFAWLTRRGKLDAMLELLTPNDALAIVAPLGAQARLTRDDFAGTDILADAALRLVRALGSSDSEDGHRMLVADFLASQPPPARWTDRRALSAWVLALVRFIVTRATPTPGARDSPPAEVLELLGGSLDWLDGPWLIDELSALARHGADAGERERRPDRPLLTPGQNRILANLDSRVRSGGVAVPKSVGENELIVRLIAAATEGLAAEETLDGTLLAAIREVARSAARSSEDPALGHSLPSTNRSPPDQRTSRAGVAPQRTTVGDTLSRYGPDAARLFQTLQAMQPMSEEPAQSTPAGGLFLLLRALLDTRLPTLASEAGVPLQPLLGALAIKWFDVHPPFDAATSLWVGTDSPDFGALADGSADVDSVQSGLLETLVARHVLDETDARGIIEADARLSSAALPCPPEADATISRIASFLIRAWSHWLPGVANSSTPFLLDNCLRRAARVRVSAALIAVDLDPSPLDVVLQMAGYLSRLDTVPWLGGRSVVFSVRKR
jgi:hypothetical protein